LEARQTEAPSAAPESDWTVGSPEVTLRLTASEARRIVRALEETSVRLGGSPSGAGMASAYIRLAGVVRQQSATAR
jgi:hypothetical protein